MSERSSGLSWVSVIALGLCAFAIGSKIQSNVFTPAVSLDHLDVAFEQARKDLRYQNDVNFRMKVDNIYRLTHDDILASRYEQAFERLSFLRKMLT